MDQIEKRLAPCISVTYSDLSEENTCRKIFETCLSREFDRNWWLKYDKMNMQMNFDEMFEYTKEYMSEIVQTMDQVKIEILDDLKSRRTKG